MEYDHSYICKAMLNQKKFAILRRDLQEKPTLLSIKKFSFLFYWTTARFEKHHEHKKGNSYVATIKETKRERNIPAFCKLPRISMFWMRFKAAWKQECWSSPEQVPCLFHSCDQKLSPSLLGQFKDTQYCCSCGFKSDIYIKSNIMRQLTLFNNEVLRIIHNAYTWTKNVLIKTFSIFAYERERFFFILHNTLQYSS